MYIVNMIDDTARPPWCPVTRTIGPYETRDDARFAAETEVVKLAALGITLTGVVAKVEETTR